MDSKKRFNQIVRDIKSVKIQGARNIAVAGLEAYSLLPNQKSKKILISLRPTEPLLFNVLEKAKQLSKEEILNHLKNSQEKINKHVFKIIKNGDVIFTHCHSSTVVNSLIYSKKHGKNFEVYNTETRPLFQGRKTSKELSKARIKVTQFVDAAAMIALTKSQGTKKVNKFFLGADAILESGVINKVGSGMFSEIAKTNKIPVYIISDSWKFSPKKLKLEQRTLDEIWKKMPKKIKARNPSFEFVPEENIKGIVSELGNLPYKKFLKKVKIY